MRFWFNRGYSLEPIAKAMMKAHPDLEIYTSPKAGAPLHQGVSGSWNDLDTTNMDEDSDEYASWAVDRIAENQIDVFIPTANRKSISKYAMQCNVHMPADMDCLNIIEDKYEFSKSIEDQESCLHTFLVEGQKAEQTLNLILQFFHTFKEGLTLCAKPRRGVNGHGFWILKGEDHSSHILHSEMRIITPQAYAAALKEQSRHQQVDDIVIMEYLPGPEVSFDILAHEGQMLKYIARTKANGMQHLQSEHPLADIARYLVKKFKLHGVVNVQFRKAKDGSWKVLEINARPAGGVVYGEEFGGTVLADWAALLMGKKQAKDIKPDNIDLKVKRVVTNEIVI